MEREETFRLTLHSMTAQECLNFLSACGEHLYNCKWHMRHALDEANTHLVECNIAGADLTGARNSMTEISTGLGLSPSSWQLLPARL